MASSRNDSIASSVRKDSTASSASTAPRRQDSAFQQQSRSNTQASSRSRVSLARSSSADSASVVDSQMLRMAAAQHGGLNAVPSFYGIRTRSTNSWAQLPEPEHKAGMDATLKEPSFRFTLYGRSWAADLVALPANALRAEMKDLYNMLWLCMRRGSYLSATDLVEFYAWFHEFAMFLEVYLMTEDTVFYPWATGAVATTEADIDVTEEDFLPPALRRDAREAEFHEIMALAVKVEESNVLFSLRPPEIALQAIAGVVDNLCLRLIRYSMLKEKHLPDALVEMRAQDDRISVERRTAAIFLGFSAFPHGLAFLARGFKHPNEVSAWSSKVLVDPKHLSSFKASRKWLQVTHLQRVQLQNERLALFGDMKLSNEMSSDSVRAEVQAAGGTSSRLHSFYSHASGLMSTAGSNVPSAVNSTAGSRQLSKANSRAVSNAEMDAALATEGAILAAASGSRAASNVTATGAAQYRLPSSVASSRNVSSVSQQQQQMKQNEALLAQNPSIRLPSTNSAASSRAASVVGSQHQRMASHASNAQISSASRKTSTASSTASFKSAVGKPPGVQQQQPVQYVVTPAAAPVASNRAQPVAPKPQQHQHPAAPKPKPPVQQQAPRPKPPAVSSAGARLASEASMASSMSRRSSSVPSEYSVSDLW